MDDHDEPAPERASALAAEIRAVAGKLKRRLREQAPAGDLTQSQISVIRRLEREGRSTASHLARAEAMRPQSMLTIIAALGAAGLVAGEPDPSDGRRTLLSLTDRGREGCRRRRAAGRDWLTRAIQARLSVGEQDAVAEALRLLERLVDD